MDYLNKIGNLHSISECNLNTKFSDKSHIDWSQSNLISIVSLDGIYILKPQLDIALGPFKIELIRNPTLKFKHHIVNEKWPSFHTMWQSMNNRQYMEAYLDPALTTNIDKLSLDSYPRRFRLAKWSPLIDSYPKHCLLAAITVDYQLLLYTRRCDTWVVQADLSSIYDTIWDQLNQQSNPAGHRWNQSENNFNLIQKSLHSLSFCGLCWKETKQSGPVLLAVTIPGDIIVWQLVPQTGINDNLKGQQYSLDLKIILQTKLEYINSMQMFHDLLIVSARDGQVVLYDLAINFSDIESKTTQHPDPSQAQPTVPPTNGLTVVKTLNLINLPPIATLWHPDNIEVTDFYIQPISQDTFRFVLAKSTNICWCIINYKQRTGDYPATLAISDSFSAIDGLDPDVALHQTPATSLRPAGDKRAVLIADDGSFFQLEFINDRQDTSPEFSAIRTGRLDLSRQVPRGLCTSPQGNLIVMISCVCLLHDPSKILAPAKLLLLPTINEKAFFVDCCEKLFDEEWLRDNNIKSPMDVIDRIDYLRSLCPLFNCKESYAFYKFLCETASAVGIPKTEEQLVKLKIANFLLIKLMRINNPRLMEGQPGEDLTLKISNSILMYNIEDILFTYLPVDPANEILEDPSLLFNIDQVRSLRNYFKWLELCPEERNSLRNKYIERFTSLEAKFCYLTQETCAICQAEIPFVSGQQGSCANGHKFSRCARSLLVLNLQTSNELVCEHCKRSFMAKLVWPTGDLWLCSFCQ